MAKKPNVVVLLLTVTSLAGLWVPASAQTAPAGYVDPEPALRAAEAAIGADRLRCVTIAGRATSGMVGQQRLHGFEVDWPRGAPLTSYSRTINWDAATMIESFDREPGRNPASWKWGLWWRGGTPLQQHSRQVFAVNGRFGWHQDGPGPPVAATTRDAELWQLDLWLNPHGFLKAARLPGANPRAV